MKKPNAFEALRQASASVRRKGRGFRLGRARPRDRIDPAMGLVLGLAIVTLGTGGWVLARMEEARGVFDPPMLTEVDDRRILTDYRDAAAPIVDMVAHGRVAALGRTDGTVHLYDMERELFSDEQIPRGPELSGALDQLASTCDAKVGCGEDAALFAVTDAGGLAARQEGAWQTLVGDSAWIGTDGTPVDQEDVRLWAVSDDGRWLLAWAEAKGFGLFDQQRSVWVDVAQDGPVAEPRHMVFAEGGFWLGGEDGLAVLYPALPSMRRPVEVVTGAVVDLERGADDRALVLESRKCSGDASCLAIYRSDGPGQARRLVGEDQISPNLSNATVEHAALQSGRFVVLGQAGIHAYDPEGRNWRVLESAAVTTYYAGREGKSIIYAAGATVGRIETGRVTLKRTAPDRVLQLLPGSGGEIFALLRDGRVMNLLPETPVEIVAADSGPGNGDGVGAATFWGDTLIALRGKDIILHDPVARRFAVQKGAVPPGVFPDRVWLVSSDRALWLVDMSSGKVFEGVMSGDWPARTITFTERTGVGLGLIDASAEGTALWLIDKSNRPWMLRKGQKTAPVLLVSSPPPQGFAPTTMVGAGNGTIFSDGRDVAVYTADTRGWSSLLPGPPGGVRDLAVGTEHIFALSKDRRLHQSDDKGWSAIVGGPQGAAVGIDQVDDAMASPGRIFLGGQGQVFAYSPGERRMTASFNGGSGAVRLLAVRGGQPEWLSGGRLLRGNDLLSGGDERVLSAGVTKGGIVYMAEQGGRSHVVGLGGDNLCLFKGTSPPTGTLVDAERLPDGRLFVATTGGLGLYEPGLRRWIRLNQGGVSSEAHLESLAGHLVLIDGTTVRGIELQDLPRPDSCDARVQMLKWRFVHEGAAVTYDEVNRRLLLLETSGFAFEWKGSGTALLPAPSEGPATGDLRRVYRVGDSLVFAGSRAVWRYDLVSRQWSSSLMKGGPSSPREIDLSPTGGTLHATVWDAGGNTFGGTENAEGLSLSLLRLPVMPRPRQSPSRITDIAQTDSFQAVLGQRALELFVTRQGDPVATVELPEAGSGWSLAGVPGTDHVLLTDGDPSRPQEIFIVDVSAARRRGTAPLSAVSSSYRPGTDRNWQVGKAALWRIDRDLVMHECALVAGKPVAQTCRASTRPPSVLDPDTLVAAVGDGEGGTLVLTRSGILHFDEDNRLDRDVTGPLDVAEGRLIFLTGRAYFWEGQGRGLYRFEEGAFVRLLPEVLDLRRGSDVFGATTPSGLVLVGPRGAPEPPMVNGRRLFAATMTSAGRVVGLAEGGEVVDLGGGGQAHVPYFHDRTEAVAPGPVPFGPQGGLRDGWWSQLDDGTLIAEWTGRCAGTQDACRQTLFTGIKLEGGERLLSVVRELGSVGIRTTRAVYRMDSQTGAVARVSAWSEMLGQSVPEATALGRTKAKIVTIDGTPYFAPPALDRSGPAHFIAEKGYGQSASLDGGRPCPGHRWTWGGCAGTVISER